MPRAGKNGSWPFVDGTSTKSKPGKAAVIRRTINGQVIEPNIKGLGRRTASYTGDRLPAN